ncbi:hypothetical protein [Streptobacillus notomytis]|uniref:hypothetical protein n=1 Tax=Streptobacillus notomytis TaxID=1712031 RepID=UPI0009365CDF|nr:hypothetical protein [Streptobacillus notomytis]
MKKNYKKLVVCKKNKRKEIKMNFLQKIEKIHTIKNLYYPAKTTKIANSYFIFISSNNTIEENKFILYYSIFHFSDYENDVIIYFKITKENVETYRKTINSFKNKNFTSYNIKKLLGDINEKF